MSGCESHCAIVIRFGSFFCCGVCFLVFVFLFVDFIQMSISKEQLALARGDSSQVQPSRAENTTSYF